VYARQVLHHTRDLARVVRECARVLKPGGAFLACREHVVDDGAQLRAFLENHPMHRLTGGEGAYPLAAYVDAISGSGLTLERVLGPWDSVINAFPTVQTAAELTRYPRTWLAARLGALGGWASLLPFVRTLVWKRLDKPVPGRLYAFLAVKP
jgi:SAM-dependent methyltransferase